MGAGWFSHPPCSLRYSCVTLSKIYIIASSLPTGAWHRLAGERHERLVVTHDTARGRFMFYVGWLAFALAANAQNPAGCLRGYVQDSNGARLAHAQVRLRAQASVF